MSGSPLAEQVGKDSASARYLTFTLNDEAYALNIFHVSEILEHHHLTAVPLTPEHVRGVINLRGRAVPVLDLAIRFGRGSTTIGRRTCVIIVHVTGRDLTASATRRDESNAAPAREVGILVDAVDAVADFAEADIEQPPEFGTNARSGCISGMARHGGGFILVLDAEGVLATDGLAMIGAAAG